jgi:2-C-methyl-D-erythritol 4-phosphate cytidylyltransferase
LKNHEKNLVIILLAGGSGKRLSLAIDKQMIKINEITVLEKNIINFQKYLPNYDIQIVTNKNNLIKTK